MNYITEINLFYEFLEVHPELSSLARLLWHTIMQCFNKKRWPHDLEIPTHKLADMMNCSRKTVERARDGLEAAGLIKVINRSGRQSPVYYFVRHTDAQPDAQNTVARHDVGLTDAQPDAQPIHLNETINDKHSLFVDVDVHAHAREEAIAQRRRGGADRKPPPDVLERAKKEFADYLDREATPREISALETCYKYFTYSQTSEREFIASLISVLESASATEVYNMSGYLINAFKGIYNEYLPIVMRKDPQ